MLKIKTGRTKSWQVDPITASVMTFNFTSAVGIIFVNKVVFKEYGFHYATFLTVCHFIVTFIGLFILTKINYFEPKKVPIMEVIPLCLAFCGFVVFNNLSLQENSVGFYQLMKVMTTPVVAAIQYFLYSIGIPKKLIFSLIPVIVGVIIVTCNEVELRLWGFIYAVCGILSTSFYQVWVKTRQQDLQLSPPQLLYYQAPISAIMVLLITPMFDQIYTNELLNDGSVKHIGLIDYPLFDNGNAFLWILFSSILAFCVNLSIFLTIGRTSPISYNVLGHFKLCLITIGGMFFFNEDMNDRKLVGIVVALTGITLYTYWKLQIGNDWDKREKEQKSKQQQIHNSSNANNHGVTNNNHITIGGGDDSEDGKRLLENVRIMHQTANGTNAINDDRSNHHTSFKNN